jgi:hypothetical protein
MALGESTAALHAVHCTCMMGRPMRRLHLYVEQSGRPSHVFLQAATGI